MTRQTTQPLVHQSLSASSRSAREVARLIVEEGDLSPAYQRTSVWSTDQRLGIIRSWLQGVPIPAVVINDRDNSGWRCDRQSTPEGGFFCAVVDGKQRIETAIAWFNGDLPAPASWFPAEHVETAIDTEDGPYVAFTGLTAVGQRIFTNHALLPVITAHEPTLEAEADLYLLLNGGGTAQTDADMDNARRVATRRG